MNTSSRRSGNIEGSFFDVCGVCIDAGSLGLSSGIRGEPVLAYGHRTLVLGGVT